MKLKLVAVAVTSLLAAGVVNAAEVYNSAHGPTFCQSSVAIPGLRLTSS